MVPKRPSSPNKIDECRFLIDISRRLMNTFSAVARLPRPVGQQAR
jgi:hypothetical protein